LYNLLTLIISVMRLINNWLTNQNAIIPNDVLGEIQNFVDTADGSDALGELVVDILQRIPDKVRFYLFGYCSNLNMYLQALLNSPCSLIISSLTPRPSSKLTPRQLAVALATLGRKSYVRIFASEYVAYARNLTSCCPNLWEAITLDKRIANWVMSSIIKLDDYKERSNVKRFFLKTAQVKCLLLGLWRT
jgi:hypothetical protein